MPGVTNGDQITVHFGCPCGMHYTATQVHLLEPRQGRFKCTVCGEVVHTWQGRYHFLDWRTATMQPVKPGEKLQ